MLRLRVARAGGVGLLLGACLVFTMPAQAQSAEAALRALPPASQALVSVPTVQATRAVPQGRVDAETGVLRAAYRLQAAPHAGAPEQAARAFLQRRHADFGMQAHARDLQVVRAVEGAHSRHVTFQQTVRGVPVYGRYVQVNLDLDGRATMVLSDYASYLDEAARRLDPQPTLDETAARAVARQAVSAEGAARTLDATLVVLPNKPVQLAWRVIALPRGVVAEWEVLVDAHRGDVIQLLDVSTCGGKHAPGAHAGHPHAPTILASEDETARALNVPGLGLVFDPDPLTTAGVPYGAPFVDQDDANIQAVNDQLFEVVLNDLTQDQDGLYRLSGPFVRIENAGSFPYQPPAEASPDGFRYARSDDRFEAVNAYYHIDKSQRYVQSLEVGRPIRESPVTVNPHGFGNNDDSRYLTNQHLIIFGTGGVDDAEDAHVIWHEYAHALLEGSAPNLLITLEGRAFHEGWADYWAASYARSLVEDGVVPPYDWRDIFRWDSGDGLFWSGRRLDRAGTYPDDTRCDDSPCGDVYPDGLIWATTLMEVYDDLGRTVTDRLALASHGYLAAPVTFRDAAEALIQADRDLYGGAHTGVLLARLGARGYVQPTAYGPVVQHTALPAVEQLGGMVEVEVLVNVAAAPIAQANLIYATNPNATPTTVPMKAAGEGRYTALIDLPDTPGEVTYYIEVTDELDLITRLPDQAPATLFRFAVGPDNVAPLVTHQVPTEVTTQAWPVEVLATVEDNLGVDSVWVDYTISRPADEPRTGTFVLRPDANNATLWRGAFPATIPVSGGTQVAYQILAQDAAAQANRSIWPAEGRYTFAVTNSGIVRAFSFEEAALGITETGAWSRGVPTFGVQVARTGDGVMATEPAASYPAAVQLSSLTLPPVDLSAQQAYLVFWHWYDFEHDGQARPGAGSPPDALLWDGGNVKVSTDEGSTWTVATPEDGYTGRLADTFGNPLGGEAGFGGYSFGWRRAIVPLPQAANVRVRFDLGTDGSNQAESIGYAGWYLDDVQITTVYPTDNTAPIVLSAPPATLERGVGEALPSLVARVTDDTGVVDVLALYELETPTRMVIDTLRLAMQPTNLRQYQGTFEPPVALQVGDFFRYRLLVRDAAGNETLQEAPDGRPFRLDIKRVARADAFAAVQPAGRWQAAREGWTVALGEGAPYSGLVLQPTTLPDNAETLRLTLRHQYALGEGQGGNLKVSADNGRSWAVLVPDAGYPAVYDAETPHPMRGEPVLQGERSETLTVDLSAYAGQQVQVRADFGASTALILGQFWTLDEATWYYATGDAEVDAFAVPLDFGLNANYPDPFTNQTTVSYTLSETGQVQLALYDVLGRRVQVLVDGVQEPGTYTVQLTSSGLASGVYLLRLNDGRRQDTERVTLVR